MARVMDDPHASLTGLVAIAMLGVLGAGGTIVADGLLRGSWLSVAAGVLVASFCPWLVYRGGRTVREHLPERNYGG